MSTLRALAVSGLAVFLFAACGDDNANQPDAGAVFQCGDGVDNDDDGLIDFPEDPGCTATSDDSENTPTAPQCSDGRDNDDDGKMDFPEDPGCISPNQDDEMDDCPSGPNCPQCSNGIDDDMNGSTDFPMDAMGCTSAADDEELVNDPMACGGTLTIKNLPIDGTDTGTFAAPALSTSMIATACGGGSNAPAIAYAINVPNPSILVISTDNPLTTVDTVVDLRSADCDDVAAEIACNDDIDPVGDPDNTSSKLTASVPAGRYYVIVQGQDASVTGDYDLSVGIFAGEGATCAMTTDCGPGLICRTPVGQTAMVCSQPVCNDGLDDDADTKTDYPADPGCESPTDDSETDDCPSGPNCPTCSNGVDDDNDTFTDYPLDTSCSAASGASEACNGERDPIVTITEPMTASTLTGAMDDRGYPDACVAFGGTFQPGGVDRLFTLTVPPLSSLTIDTNGVTPPDVILSLLSATCAEPNLACDDEDGDPFGAALVQVSNVAAGTYIVVVDGYNDEETGPFALNVKGVLTSGQSCEAANTLNGAFECPVTHPCGGPAGARICQPPACSNTIDDDGDGRIDFPNEPGCANALDTDEADTCPGAGCPVCSNGTDDDSDNATDYPADPNCSSAAGGSEFACGELDPIVTITGATTAGTLAGASNEHAYPTTCGSTSTTNTGVERTYAITVPALTSFTADTDGMATDTVIEVLPPSCVGPLACDDEGGVTGNSARATVSPLPAGSYLIVVNAYVGTTTGAYDLHVSGVLPLGASCEMAATLNGAFTCPPASLCQGVAGAQTCQATQCSNTIDEDGDGSVGFPSDPGCTSAADNDEADDCPSGPNCPQCSNDLDDDSDGMFDYPADTSCTSASGTSEFTPPCGDTDPVVAITGPTTAGTLVGATNNHQYPTTPVCGSTSTTNTGVERTYSITIPALSSFTADTDGMTTNTVLELLPPTCVGPIDCDDEGGVSTGAALVTAGPLAAGPYLVVVNAFSSTSTLGAYNLHVSGTLMVDGSCEMADTLGGAFTCPATTLCQGAAGARTCELTQCSSTTDDDGDGDGLGFPSDPGCTSVSDNDESDDCPSGPNCPQCSNDLDDDSDGMFDYPADLSCTSASGTSEATPPCGETDPVLAITGPSTSGTLVGATDNRDYPNACTTLVSSAGSGPERTYTLALPAAVSSLKFDTSTASPTDVIVSLLNSTCAEPNLGCDDESGDPFGAALLSTGPIAAGNYLVSIDAWSPSTTLTNGYTLTFSGVLAVGSSCEPAATVGGALVCPAANPCTGTVGTRVCQ